MICCKKNFSIFNWGFIINFTKKRAIAFETITQPALWLGLIELFTEISISNHYVELLQKILFFYIILKRNIWTIPFPILVIIYFNFHLIIHSFVFEGFIIIFGIKLLPLLVILVFRYQKNNPMSVLLVNCRRIFYLLQIIL